MAKQPKYYVVWHGRETGVFDSWEACKEQTAGFHGAIFKSFLSRETAERAFAEESSNYIRRKKVAENKLTKEELQLIGNPIEDSIAVDGAWNTETGIVEYKGVYNKTYEVLFHQGPYQDGTNNIVEFIAIVHALALCKKWHWKIPIYSDSKTAIRWVKDKRAKTKHAVGDKNKKLFDILGRAEKWLQTNEYENPILKWETKAWGENPADFGRK